MKETQLLKGLHKTTTESPSKTPYIRCGAFQKIQPARSASKNKSKEKEKE